MLFTNHNEALIISITHQFLSKRQVLSPLTNQALVVRRMDKSGYISIFWIMQYFFLILILWIVSYPLDNVIFPLNYWVQNAKFVDHGKPLLGSFPIFLQMLPADASCRRFLQTLSATLINEDLYFVLKLLTSIFDLQIIRRPEDKRYIAGE